MKFASFRSGRAERFGVLKGTGVIDISVRLGNRYPDLRTFIADADWRNVAERLLASESPDHDFEQLELLSVVPNAAKILCVALNYHDHIAEANRVDAFRL
jgi:2-keto-4-pentenoate hydratase/2-oxohepta-3-ene-1,7-dioic acid hydratase in catechol pathway